MKTISDCVRDIKKREQAELTEAVRKYGNRTGLGYVYEFASDCPIVAAYSYDEPCDVVVLMVKVTDEGSISFRVDEKINRYNEHEIEADDVFAGQLDYITSNIRKNL
jgi:hypothetical protein